MFNKIMRTTILISESCYVISKKVANILSLMLGPSKHFNIDDKLPDINKYNNIVLIFAFYGYNTAEKLKKYLSSIKDTLKNKRIAIVGVGLSEKSIINYILSIEKAMEREADIVDFVQGEIKIVELTKDDRKKTKSFPKRETYVINRYGNF